MDFPWQKKLKWNENLFGEEEKAKVKAKKFHPQKI